MSAGIALPSFAKQPYLHMGRQVVGITESVVNNIYEHIKHNSFAMIEQQKEMIKSVFECLFQDITIKERNENTVDMAHASVASLMRTIESLLTINSPMRSLSCDHREELCALREKVSSLEVFVKNFEKNNVSGEMTDFETHERLSDTLQLVAEDIDCIWKVSTKIQDKGKQVSEGSLVQDISSSTNNILKVNNNMVGRDDQKERLLEDLTGSYSGEPKVIPIVGMGGIGSFVEPSAIDDQIDDTVKMSGEAELADKLQKSLKRKRYLIVLDDIWSFEVWDGVTRCFPTEDNAGSRILLTTRNNEVACYADIENISLQMSFMDQDESWSLFKSAAFSSEALTYEFETVGKQIADECHGLPLTIVVVAGLLKSKRAIEDWESVAKDVKSFITNDPDERCSRVLGLSYDHLRSDLKTCLLHFGIFPEDSDIPVKRLLWNLQTFIVQRTQTSIVQRLRTYIVPSVLITFPEEIWGLMQLRHLKLPRFYLPDCPSGSVDKGRHLDFSNSQTISYLYPRCCTKEVIMGIQNVKELGICGYETDLSIRDSGLPNNLVHLQQLETLSIMLCFKLLPASAIAFPAMLKKLKLEATALSWSYLDIIAELPNLEVLKLMGGACGGYEWHPNVRGFTRLKFLLISDNSLKYWKATDDNFPVLERLVLKESRNLKEIPIEFAEIYTLQLIELDWCLPELGESAARIQKEQEDIGNNPVNVRISNPCKYIVI
ncbi:hypothetical protein CQW23_06839 [Capsicum baccatum]|uniref:NB-ARC domain-containing protein n=1 Tax=Capsicum baccatum TaxID=33114 RepID=A0A2G2X4H9_CAPBA|nr:hypothetical protein CQW23_06839 [Capsicum baccatum]